MTATITRGRLLAGAALGLGLAVFTPTQAEAACVVNPAASPVTGTVVCGTTTTDNTTYPVNAATGEDREYLVDTSAGDVTGTVSAGAVVDGNGLAFTNTVGGANDLIIVNDGTVQVDLGSAPTAGGTAALDISAIGATNVDYSGTGDIFNLGTGTALRIDHTGTGNITAVVGGSVSSVTEEGINLQHLGTAGNLSLTTTAGETILAGTGQDGIEVEILNAANAGTVIVNNEAAVGSNVANTMIDGVEATTAGTGSVTVTNNGDIGSATDRPTDSGITAQISNAGSTAALSVTGSGDIFSAGDGILVSNVGTGTTTVDYTGAIDTTGATGVEVIATTGATTVTLGDVTAATDAVVVTSTGDQDITLTGVTTGTAGSGLVTTTTGARTITVDADGDVTGATEAILIAGTGDADISNAGIIGAAATDLAVNAVGGGIITLTNEATGTLNGVITLGAAADSVTNAGLWDTEGVNDFGAGVDVLTNETTGTIEVGAATSFVGLETLDNAGTINAATGLTFDAGNTILTNTGDINAAGTIDFGGGVDDFSNDAGGAFSLTGDTTLAGLETFSNDGLIDLSTFTLTGPAIAFVNTGTIDTDGNAAVAGFTTFDNDGVLDLGPGTFTVIAGVPFTNSGTIRADEGASTITGQTVFNNSGTIDLQDGVANDELTIDSDFVGLAGSNLDIDFTGTVSDRLVIDGAASGSTSIDAAYLGGFNLDGVLVVDAVTADDDAFILGAVTGDSPLVDFELVQDGGDFFLIAAPTEETFTPLLVPGFAMDLWYQSADEIFAETVKPATTVGFSFWGEGYISRDKYGDSDDNVTVDGIEFEVDNELKTDRHGLQVGMDYGFGGGRVGLTGGYAWAKADGNADADLRARGWNLGVYGQFGGVTGFHGEFLAKYDRYNAEFEDGAFDGADFDIKSRGIDGSVGYRFGFSDAATMDVHAGVSHVKTKIDDIGAFGLAYDFDDATSTRGRAGIRAILGGSLSPYIDGTVYHEFSGDRDVDLFDGLNTYDVGNSGKGTWVRIEGGLSGNDGPGPILALWGDLGDRKGLGLRAGWRFGGRVAEALPPPPPPPAVAPPPPPPPATQTCPDGSVILATDMCPPPPPPPPPPPEPERG